MSGTSVDAIDFAICDIDVVAGEFRLDLVAHGERSWEESTRSRILALLPPNQTTIGEITELDQVIGQAFAQVAGELCEQLDGVELVASHGQTVYHWVEQGKAKGTLQLGQPAWIQRVTGLPVVSDLRAADIAAGGQGAPLVSILDAIMFSGEPSVVVNLGGISNVTIIESGGCMVSGDTGPANALMDAVVQRDSAGERHYDRNGEIAATGTVDEELLAALREHPYFALPMPKSTGREVFSVAWYDQVLAGLGRELSLGDQLATLARLTSSTLFDQIEQYEVERLVVSGGGSHNPVLMADLAERYRVVNADELGIPGDAKEAVLIALLGWLSWTGRAGVAVDQQGRPLTGASEPVVLGTITAAGRAGH